MEIVISSFSTQKEAKKFARVAVEKRLASCAAYYKINSIYFWNKEKVEGEEWIVEFKTANSKKLFEFLEKNHPYSCPMIYIIKPSKVNRKYLKWLENYEKK
ncbi:MAG: divalent cation tolerance protein CutA [Candidatus Anstonellaceae archaeon]